MSEDSIIVNARELAFQKAVKNYLKKFGETNEPVRGILRNSSPEKSQFQSYMQPLFQDRVNYFVQDFLSSLKKSMTQ